MYVILHNRGHRWVYFQKIRRFSTKNFKFILAFQDVYQNDAAPINYLLGVSSKAVTASATF